MNYFTQYQDNKGHLNKSSQSGEHFKYSPVVLMDMGIQNDAGINNEKTKPSSYLHAG